MLSKFMQHPVLNPVFALMLVFALLLAPALTPTAWAAPGDGAVQYEGPVSGYVIDCEGNYVYVEGYVKGTYNITADGNGGFHINDNGGYRNLQSADGSVRVQGNWHYSYNAVGATNQQYSATFDVITKGQAQNSKASSTYMVTVNANGTITHQTSNYEFRCVGAGA